MKVGCIKMIDISKMTMSELINFTREASEKDILDLIDNKEYLLKLDLTRLNIFYLNLNIWDYIRIGKNGANVL